MSVDQMNGSEADGAEPRPVAHKTIQQREDHTKTPHPGTNGGTSGVKEEPRFRIFIVDSGWNSAARKVLYDNFALIRDLQRENPIYFLGKERSVELMRQYPELVGKDPIIRVHASATRKRQQKPGFHGFRLHLGLLQSAEDALQALQNFAKFISMHRDSADLEADMRSRLRQEGLQGAFEIVLHGEAHGVSI